MDTEYYVFVSVCIMVKSSSFYISRNVSVTSVLILLLVKHLLSTYSVLKTVSSFRDMEANETEVDYRLERNTGKETDD